MMLPADTRLFRHAMARYATGVTVVTARAGPRRHGMTVNSFTSVSLDPPLVLWCAESGSRTLALIRESGVYGVSILGEDQEFLSRHFAARSVEGVDRFEGIEVFEGPTTGCPLLREALATFECRLEADHAMGDHHILVARVEALRVGPDSEPPLVFYGSRYRRLAESV